MAHVSHSLAKRHCLINASYSEMQALLQFFMQIYTNQNIHPLPHLRHFVIFNSVSNF